ncbi:hypothetical protein AB5J62_04035 [Amycolatopsis sp. cg5]|uniref:hypothetical protein n=1 Tax=Amycolatopsis sp. cg5 TaxID=3238802 RepID=UPI0035268E94
MTVVEPANLVPTRKALQHLLLPGERELHFRKEKPPRRRQLADRMKVMPVSARLYSATCTRKTEESARQACLFRAITDLLGLRAHRLVLDTRDDRNAHDKQTLRRALGNRPSTTEMTYEHLDSTAEPLLWLSDAIAWCHGAGGEWRTRIAPLVTAIICP